MKGYKKLDVEVGDRIGAFKVAGISRRGLNGKVRGLRYICECVCGTYVEREPSRLHIAYSCGCKIQNGNPIEGYDYYHPTTHVWHSMVQRCTNPKNHAYHNYGARGISVCEEWLGSAAVFQRWALSNGWAPKLTLDRIDNDGPYSPENCRFVTRKENCANRRVTKKVFFRGQERILTELYAEFKTKESPNYQGLLLRLNRYKWDIERALLTPAKIGRHPNVKTC